MSALQVICILIMQVSTIIGVTSFVVAVFNIYKKISILGEKNTRVIKPILPRVKYVVKSAFAFCFKINLLSRSLTG